MKDNEYIKGDIEHNVKVALRKLKEAYWSNNPEQYAQQFVQAEKYAGFMEMEMYTDDDAVEAIEGVPSAHHFDEWCTDCKEYDKERHCCPRFNRVIRTTLQEVKEDRKKGVWIEENTRPRSSQFYCSVCHRTAYDPQPTRAKGWVKRCRYAFCPNCGADMREKE